MASLKLFVPCRAQVANFGRHVTVTSLHLHCPTGYKVVISRALGMHGIQPSLASVPCVRDITIT